METLAPVPANAEEISLGSAYADATAKPTEDVESAPTAPEAGTSEPKVKDDPVQKRIDQLTREKYDNARLADQRGYELEREKAERERLTAELAALRKSETTQVAPENNFPTLEQYGYDEGKYQAAVAAHYSKIAAEQGTKAAQAALQEERARQSEEQTQKGWASREAEFIKSRPDYVEKVKNANSLPISLEIQKELMASDLGPQVALHLVENHARALEIMRMPVAAQLREIGRIEARLEIAKNPPPPPVVSQAPPPPSKLEADAAVRNISSTDPDSDKLTDAEWVKAETARMKRKQKRAS